MVDLTKYAAKGGCACKIGPHILEDVLQHMKMPTHPAVLTDASGMEDAGVYQINESQAIEDCQKSVGIISTETIVAQHPWVNDSKAELEKIKKEKDNAIEEIENTYKGHNHE